MNEEKRCSNCVHPDMSRGYLGCGPMDFVPLTPFSTCIKWVAEHQAPVTVDEEEIPAELLGVTEDTNVVQYVPGIGIVEEPAEDLLSAGASAIEEWFADDVKGEVKSATGDKSVLDILLSDIAEEEPVVDAECAPKQVDELTADETTGALDAIAKVIPRLPDMIDEVAAMEPEDKTAFIDGIKQDMRADQDAVYMESIDLIQFALQEVKRIYENKPELLPEILGMDSATLRIIEDFVKTLPAYNGTSTSKQIVANAVGTLDSQKYPDLLTLTYKGCAIAVPATDAVLDINKKFKQFIDKNVVVW